ncbi:NAD(+) diphosphatase [Paremcibacter congregatus]|uniref:NAD(+) diphosphatase n=1 Tax=Paremcibacter congregatus TaxID=2043170 RepID=A0A2G4YWC8_9PROT|nr:NAD(+) diphosphatase [Paremcibacter congregatus]PHZ86647.1 NAD(+) diphosphatase [Paremcibacter congregatus]QDE26448.1 NAD(+) diphosphatase [Paremcibacter congregatus]
MTDLAAMGASETAPCIFTGFPLDTADHLRGDQAWLKQQLSESSTHFLIYAGGCPLMDVSDGLHPGFKFSDELDSFLGENWRENDWVFIGLDDHQNAFFAGAVKGNVTLQGHEKFIDLRSVALQVGQGGFSDIPSLLGRGKMLLEWHGRRHYCSSCGGKSISERGGYVRKCQNKDCGAEHFPRTDPVVIMMVYKGDNCLLGRGVGWPEGNYSALAGFMEPGESIEEATRREVLEESGIKIGKVTYVQSQPWPFPSTLMIGVMAEALTEDITIDKTELSDARWFSRDELKAKMANGGDDEFRVPPTLAIARHLLENWLK